MTEGVPPPPPFPETRPPAESRAVDEIQRVLDLVRQRFTISQEYLREGEALEFFLDPAQKDVKMNFKSLVSELGKSGDTAMLRNTDHGLLLIVTKKFAYPKQRLKLPVALFLATIIAVIADGFIRTYYYRDPVTQSVSISEGITIALIYAVSLMGIIGIHELGHKVSAWRHKMASSWPYFIPGIPGILPTFGAVIRAGEPPVNRDALFDLGLSGPVFGLAATVVVSLFAAMSARLIPVSSLPTSLPGGSFDYYSSFLVTLFKGSPSYNTAVVGPLFYLLYIAYSLGFLLTFINLFPAWQLDGGHIANSALSPRVHRILTYVSAGVMFFIGFWIMALLILFMSSASPSLRPLDDVSPLSNTRKILFALTWVLCALIYVFVLYNNAVFSLQPLIHL